MKRTAVRCLAVLVIAGVFGAACAKNSPKNSSAGDRTTVTAPAPASVWAQGAELRAALTAKLEAHVFLIGIATSTVIAGGSLDAPAATLDKNSVELSQVIASVYGDAAGQQFLQLWRKHIGFLVNFAMAKVRNDAPTASKAMTDLDGYRSDYGAFFASANPDVTKDAVAQGLVPSVTTLLDAINAQAAKDPLANDKLKAAADVALEEAKVLAGTIARQFPTKFPAA